MLCKSQQVQTEVSAMLTDKTVLLKTASVELIQDCWQEYLELATRRALHKALIG